MSFKIGQEMSPREVLLTLKSLFNFRNNMFEEQAPQSPFISKDGSRLYVGWNPHQSMGFLRAKVEGQTYTISLYNHVNSVETLESEITITTDDASKIFLACSEACFFEALWYN